MNLSLSALTIVKDRESKIKGTTLEIKSVIDDYKMQRMSVLEAAWILWDRLLVPSLLSGAGFWIGNIQYTKEFCNNI